jgi:hypothetical protein
MEYRLYDHEGNEIYEIDFHGESYRVDFIDAEGIGIDDENVGYIEIEELKEQDDNVSHIGIK